MEDYHAKLGRLFSLAIKFHSQSKVGSDLELRYGDQVPWVNTPKDETYHHFDLRSVEGRSFNCQGFFLFSNGRILFWNERFFPQWTSIDNWYLTDLRRQVRDHIALDNYAKEYDLKTRKRDAFERGVILFRPAEMEEK